MIRIIKSKMNIVTVIRIWWIMCLKSHHDATYLNGPEIDILLKENNFLNIFSIIFLFIYPGAFKVLGLFPPFILFFLIQQDSCLFMFGAQSFV